MKKRFEDLNGVFGDFDGVVTGAKLFRRRAYASGRLTYTRGDTQEKITIPIHNVLVRVLSGPDYLDTRRYIRVHRGTDKILGLIDKQ